MTHSWTKTVNCTIPLLLSLALAIPAMADSNLSQIQTSASQGDPSAQYSLGLKYYSGEGVSQSYNKAFQWYQKAANQNYSDAQYNLGHMYENGKGTSRDLSKALNWYKKSALQGDADAQNQLGLIYSKTSYQDWDKAMDWYLKAANQNHAKAQSNVGKLYYYGFGVPKNKDEAFDWFKKSADQGNQQAQTKVDEISNFRLSMKSIDDKLNKSRNYLIDQGYSNYSSNSIVGSLSDSSSKIENMSILSNGTYALIAACAMDCSKINLYVYDRDGNLLSKAIDDENNSIVQFEATYTGDYDIKVDFDCKAESCSYEIRGYEPMSDAEIMYSCIVCDFL